MKRYSIVWWLAILPTTVVVGVPVYLLLGYHTDWGVTERIAVALVCAVVVDLAFAAWMERVAPTRVNIGPGERRTGTGMAADRAIVIGGFDESAEGRVSVRGETWNAIRSPNDTGNLSAGMAVHVVDRIGLNLIISARID